MNLEVNFSRSKTVLSCLALTLSGVNLSALAQTQPPVVPGSYAAVNLLTTGNDVLGKPLSYPECKPLIKSMIITMAPGEVGKMHRHDTPLYAYMLSGKIKVDYQDGARTSNVYKAGDALVEAMIVDHVGYNPFDEPAKLLAVYLDCQPQ